MFQYAFFIKYKELKENVKIDIGFYEHTPIHNNYELEKIFGIKEVFCTKNELINLKDINKSIYNKIKRKIFGWKPQTYYEHTIDYSYKPEIFNLTKPTYLQGCWISAKYFEDIEEIIRQKYIFPNFTDIQNINLYKLIKERNSVSVHIRRGDYLKDKKYTGICEEIYYKKAVEYAIANINKPYFIIFSDDILWCKQNLSFFNNTEHKYIDWNKGTNNYRDMQIMTICKHNIIANSTFSWWGAWLNNNANKIIISPSKWFAVDKLNNISLIQRSWIKISI